MNSEDFESNISDILFDIGIIPGLVVLLSLPNCDVFWMGMDDDEWYPEFTTIEDFENADEIQLQIVDELLEFCNRLNNQISIAEDKILSLKEVILKEDSHEAGL